MVVSAPLDTSGHGLGALFVFDVKCPDCCEEIGSPGAKISPLGSIDSERQFGKELAMHRDGNMSVIIASSPYEDGSLGAQENQGAVYVFREATVNSHEDKNRYYNESIMVPSPSNRHKCNILDVVAICNNLLI